MKKSTRDFKKFSQNTCFHCSKKKKIKFKKRKEGSDFLWTSDRSDVKQFVEKVLNLRGKWSSPGGETKQFVSDKIIIKWYGPTKKKIVLVADNKEIKTLYKTAYRVWSVRIYILKIKTLKTTHNHIVSEGLSKRDKEFHRARLTVF